MTIQSLMICFFLVLCYQGAMPVYQITLSLQTIDGFCFLWVFTFASRSCRDKIFRFYFSVFFFVLVLIENIYQTLEAVFCYSYKLLEVRQNTPLSVVNNCSLFEGFLKNTTERRFPFWHICFRSKNINVFVLCKLGK